MAIDAQAKRQDKARQPARPMSEQTIYRALCPRVAVLSSPDVAVIAKDNGCDDFAQLLRPFESQIQNITVRTSQLKPRQCPTFPLRIDQLSAFEDGTSSEVNRHPEEVLDAVTAHISTHARRWDSEVPRIEVAERADLRPEHTQTPVDQLAPWFADFRELILGNRAVSEHETFGHPIALLITVSSACPDPVSAFAQLHEQSQQPTAYTQRPYMQLDVLRYYIVLHDISRSGPDMSHSEQLLQHVRATYGLHCCILPINSAGEGTQKSEGFSTMWTRALRRDPRAPLLRPNIATPEPPPSAPASGSLDVPAVPPRWHTPQPEAQDKHQADLTPPASSADTSLGEGDESHPFGAALDDEDVRRLKAFLREFTAQSLVPHVEKCVQVWNEQVAASRRGITGKLFGAGRRMFGAARTTPAGQPPGFDAHRQIYPAGAIEALTRKLADFAFWTRDLKLAASLYEMSRKDFVNDKAWKYAAGASEMLGLCQLLQAGASASSSSAEAEALLGQACHEFSLGNHTQLSAIRASLLFYEAQRSIQDWRNVEPVLIRAAGFAEEISSAIFLEQAALANLRQARPALRKFAVRLVMAGHRYHDCGQKYLALRCYAQAAAFYRFKDWSLISNHIEHELGKQAYMEGNANQAVQHLLRVVRPTEGSNVSADTYLGELFSAFKYTDVQSSSSKPAELAFELFPSKDCRFDLSATGGTPEKDEVWSGMEERFLRTGFPVGSLSPDGRLRKRPMQLTSASQDIVVGMNESLPLVLAVRNPLSTDLDLSDIRAQVVEEGPDGDETQPSGLQIESVPSLKAAANQTCTFSLQATATRIGRYRIRGIFFTMGDSIPFYQPLEKKGSRLYATKEHRTSTSYGPDRTLALRVCESRPQLVLELLEAPQHLFHGEEAELVARLTNVGHDDMTDIRLLSSDASCLALVEQADGSAGVELAEMTNVLREDGPADIALPAGKLAKGQHVDVKLRLRAIFPGTLVARGLLVYQSDAGEVFSARMAHALEVLPSLLVTADCYPVSNDEPGSVLDLTIRNVSPHMREMHISAITAISANKTVHLLADASLEGLKVKMDSFQSVRASIPLKVEAGAEQDDTLLIKQLRSLLRPKRDEKEPPLPDYSAQKVHVEQERIHASEALRLSPFLTAVRRAWRLRSLGAEFGAIGELDRRRVFPLFDSNEVDLLVHWHSSAPESEAGAESEATTSQRTPAGFIPLFGIKLGPLRNRLETLVDGGKSIRSLYAETAKEQAALLNNILTSSLGVSENPVMVSLVADSTVLHDFSRGTARISIKLRLRNLSDCQTARFQLQLLQSDEDVDTPLPIAPWVGRTSFRGELAPGAMHTVAAQALVERAAVVSSGLWTGEVTVEDAGRSTFLVPGTERVIVNVQQQEPAAGA
ncbi:hypothetical protein OC835_002828 [Tilletia horrida]|nr:hypothetical protein OC835_002828 [Tilletia horrida]